MRCVKRLKTMAQDELWTVSEEDSEARSPMLEVRGTRVLSLGYRERGRERGGS